MRKPPSPDRSELSDLIRKAVEAFNAMTPEQQAAMIDAQRKSWVRGMTARC
jgi:hypothetical protein